ncbi:hypothetical protein L226DRAFT_86335 [Lentinus tigrinus ALCF2SS1-7]|uniref:uncharacterized protein n=1 Tax=Lentinus tigrinus ALCF2SS1-7 TaxID=1328758 RepID=UPI0011660363|nr:hypothetical protein L226DRAFT_86335 [Lentinus tigrinus ALCF2SS1-7]
MRGGTTSLVRSVVVLFVMLALLCQLGAAGVLGTHDRKDVFDPPVLYPHAGTVWYKGQRHNVTWDVSDPPPYIINPVDRIFMRKREHYHPSDFGDELRYHAWPDPSDRAVGPT